METVSEQSGRRWWPVLVPIVLLGAAVTILIPAGRHQWALTLFRQPTYYTALSFDKAWALPVSAVKGQSIKVSFTIGNHQGRAVNYEYVVANSAAGKSQTLQKGAVLVRAGGTWTVSTVVRPSCDSSPCRVQVSLPGHPENIFFFIALKTRRRSADD